MIWLVFSDTGSALDVAYVGTSFLIAAALFSTLGGTLVDRYDRRRLMILADLIRAAGLGGLVLLLAARGFNLPAVVGVSGILGAFTALFNPAEQAIVPAIVPLGHVADANGLVRSSRSTVGFVGASMGGLLIVTVGSLWGIGLESVTFAVSALLITRMRIPPLPTSQQQPLRAVSYLSDLRDGFRWLWHAQGFLQLTLSAMFFNFSSNLIGTFLVVYATLVLHGSALVYAALLAAEVAGSAIGPLLVGRLGAARYAGKAWVVPYGVVSGVIALLLSLFPSIPLAVVVLFVLGLLGAFSGTAWLTAAQLLVPSRMQGRYFGVDALGSVAILPLAQIGGALLIVGYGTRTTYLAAAVLWVVAGVAFLFPRALWNLGVTPTGEVSSRTDGDGAGTP